MVRMPAGFCVDTTEVSRAQYAAWLATSPATTGQPAVCGFNASFTPECNMPIAAGDPTPVTCVDWCDAAAYCAGVGKRLCGKIGGGANSYLAPTNPATSQWFNACSNGGTTVYPYGATHNPLACNGGGQTGAVQAVGTQASCQSSTAGYAGLLDMSGNVYEWEDSCNGTAQNAVCHVRGGFFNSSDTQLQCGSPGLNIERNRTEPTLGFRCCAG